MKRENVINVVYFMNMEAEIIDSEAFESGLELANEGE